MTLEELFNHFQYVSYKRLAGVGLFSKDLSPTVTFYYTDKETLFTDGTILEKDEEIGMLIVENATYCISAYYFDEKKFSNPSDIRFEVYLGDETEETRNNAAERIRKLSKKVHYRELKKSNHKGEKKND